MIQSFQFAALPKIIFGVGKIASLHNEIGKIGTNVLFLTGGKSFRQTPQFSKFIQPLLDKNHAFIESIQSEPSPIIIDEITGKYNSTTIDVVVAIGGGSVLDAGKAVSAMLPLSGKIKDYLEGVGHLKPTGEKIPFIAIPTTSGTGSETTKNAVISEIGPNGFKKSLRHDNYVPDVAILDPELVLSCPKDITSASGMDAFTQLLEAFLSPTCDEMTSSLCISGLKAVKRSLLKVCEDGNNIDARTDIAYASMISGIALANAGLGTIHGFASPIGAICDIPHGVVCGTMMAVCNKYTVEGLRVQRVKRVKKGIVSLEKYWIVANIFVDDDVDKEEKVDLFIDWLYEITQKLNIPSLGYYGISTSDIPTIIAGTGNKNNPMKLGEDEMKAILVERI